MHQVKLTKKAKKQLIKIPEPHKRRIKKALLSLARDPGQGKRLVGIFSGYRTVRVWPYRIVYVIKDNELLVIVYAIAHRQGVYK